MNPSMRLSLVLVVVLLVPIVPFLVLGDGWEHRVRQWLTEYHAPWQIAAVIVGLLSTDVLLPVPSSFVSTYGGAKLGAAWGTAASWTGMSIGATLGFVLARRWGQPLAARLTSGQDLQRMQQAGQRYGPALLVLTRAIPVLAEACVLWLGIQRLSWRRFLLPVALSNLGIAAAYSIFGRVAERYGWFPLAMGISVALPLLLVLVARRWLFPDASPASDRDS